MPNPKTLLFTAFEPSGDEHAAHVIEQIKQRHPETTIYALGGPKMQAAGAILLETTTEKAVMLLGIVGEIRPHLQRLKRLKAWLNEHVIDGFIPTDSPAANWSVCKLVRRVQPKAKIIHLVMPQVWAWASWRVKRLQKWSDHVLCLLSFEPQWLEKHRVRGTFVGHPLFDPPPNAGDYLADIKQFPDAEKKLALLPGSRRSEISRNWETMLASFLELKKRYPKLRGVLALRNEAALGWVDLAGEKVLGGKSLAEVGIEICLGRTDAGIAWADVVLVCSGTATLQVCAHGKPMVVIYNTSRWQWGLLSRLLISTRTFALPNLISEAMGMGRVCRELVPHFGAVDPVVAGVGELLAGGAVYEREKEAYRRIKDDFAGKNYGMLSAGVIFEVMG